MRTYRLAAAGALPPLLAVAIGGCTLGEVTAAEGGDVLVVEAYLEGALRMPQKVLLHRSLRDGAARAEPGAEVTITGPDGNTVRLGETALHVCSEIPEPDPENPIEVEATCYVAHFLRVEPGATYELEVVTAQGERVRGRTTVPGDFRGRRPVIASTESFPACSLPPRTNLELIWSESEGAWSYLATLEVSGLESALEGTGIETPDRVELTGLSISQSDTTLVMPSEFGLFELTTLDQDLIAYLQNGFPSGVTARLRLSAIDRNYVNAIRGGSFNPSGTIRISSVVGDGIGVFASYVPRDLFVVVEEDSALPPC